MIKVVTDGTPETKQDTMICNCNLTITTLTRDRSVSGGRGDGGGSYRLFCLLFHFERLRKF